MVKHILITGASGLIGTRLTEMLLAKGYSVAHLGRSKKEDGVKSFIWNVDKQIIQPGALKGITAVIHLAGAGVAEKRWTEERKQEILESRTKSTALLLDELKKGHHTVTSFISASAIGFYGFEHDDKVFHEDDAPGTDFLAQVTRQWEDEVSKISNLGIRVVKIRVGVVLSEKGGALKEMSTPIRLYAGSPLGTGKQMMSWIHLDDLCAIFIKMLEEEQHIGTFNAVTPHPVSNAELTKAIAEVLHKPLLFPKVPAFALKFVLGEMANLVLNGSTVSADKIVKTGFKFQYEDLKHALNNLLQKH